MFRNYYEKLLILKSESGKIGSTQIPPPEFLMLSNDETVYNKFKFIPFHFEKSSSESVGEKIDHARNMLYFFIGVDIKIGSRGYKGRSKDYIIKKLKNNPSKYVDITKNDN